MIGGGKTSLHQPCDGVVGTWHSKPRDEAPIQLWLERYRVTQAWFERCRQAARIDIWGCIDVGLIAGELRRPKECDPVRVTVRVCKSDSAGSLLGSVFVALVSGFSCLRHPTRRTMGNSDEKPLRCLHRRVRADPGPFQSTRNRVGHIEQRRRLIPVAVPN